MKSETTEQSATKQETTVEGLKAEIEHLQKALEEAQRAPTRMQLPVTRQSITHKFSVSGHEGYITVGLYADGRPGEVFLTMAKEGSTVGA